MREAGNTDNLYQSILRSKELKKDTLAFLEYVKSLPDIEEQAAERKHRILEVLGGTEEDWNNWKWQLRNRVKDSIVLDKIIGLSDLDRKRIDKVGKLFRWAISPYYLSLVTVDYQNSPIYRQAIPDIRELSPGGSLDPMNEAITSPAPCVTRRYPDRMIINVTNQCAMYCRHCQRRRNIGEIDQHACLEDIGIALDYVAQNKEIRDVLITGGDALLLSNQTLEFILHKLHKISHVEIKRIGTRTPVTMPQRITPELVEIIRKYPPIFINTQFNHPLEVTPEAKSACDSLAEGGVVLGNQSVLLRGINDESFIMRKLFQELLKIRARPYYIFHAKNVQGTCHFQTSIAQGLNIIESLRGHTSGLAIPTFVVNAPGGLGKIPIMPNYIKKIQKNKVLLRTWEGKLVQIEDCQ
ncbi:MAG TPA: lysine 2,3-aminomutase [Desulfotomaculum sp.]|nr:MAG: Lysine 2,3-aminomutase YodO family protein [Desulfotomaculum sp. 46_80]HAG11783.1 lysine 2,3-aminomutase [Desulfotomaculum sp.]HBY03822.1 lysine 2,3-aminomutase [Desulfotomaculum sp.]